MEFKTGIQARKEVEALLQAKKLFGKIVLVVGDRGFRIDVTAGDQATKVRNALPLKVNGVAVIVVP